MPSQANNKRRLTSGLEDAADRCFSILFTVMKLAREELFVKSFAGCIVVQDAINSKRKANEDLATRSFFCKQDRALLFQVFE